MNIRFFAILGSSLAALLAGLPARAAESLPIRTLAKGAFSGIREARQQLITDAAAWEKTWKQHATNPGAADKAPAVDFSREMVVVTTMGTRPTGGYTIEITNAEVKGRKLRLSVRQTSPPRGAMTIQAFTAPFHFIAVPRHGKVKAEFVDADSAGK